MAKQKLRIRRDDVVVVIAGRDQGKTGKVLEVRPAEGRVVVEGVQLVKRHVKAQGDRPGSIVEREAAVHISNVALWNAETGKKIKVGYKVEADGQKVRVDRKTGAPV